MAANYVKLRGLFEAKGIEAATEEVKGYFQEKSLRPTDFDFGAMFAEYFGWHNFRAIREGKAHPQDVMNRALLEADGAVTTAAFVNISGQFMYQTVLDGYNREEMPFTKLIPERPASTLQGEKIPGVTDIGDEIQERGEGDRYAYAGVGEDWIFTPPIVDRGVIVALTFESVFNDKTGQLVEKASEVGYFGAVNREKRAIDCVIDENRTTHRYNWRGTTIASYGDNSGSHTWDNLAASNGLVDWTDLDNAEQVSNQITNPYTGEPVTWELKHLVHTKQLEQTVHHILRSTSYTRVTPGYATTDNPNRNDIPNPYLNKYQSVTSRLLRDRLATDTTWFLADLSTYAVWMKAEGPTVLPAPANDPDSYFRRVVSQWRFNEFGEYVVRQPRASIKNTVA